MVKSGKVPARVPGPGPELERADVVARPVRASSGGAVPAAASEPKLVPSRAAGVENGRETAGTENAAGLIRRTSADLVDEVLDHQLQRFFLEEGGGEEEGEAKAEAEAEGEGEGGEDLRKERGAAAAAAQSAGGSGEPGTRPASAVLTEEVTAAVIDGVVHGWAAPSWLA